MFDRSWICPSLREFIDERLLKRIPLRRLATNGSKNLRNNWPTEADRQRLAALAAMAMADEKQTAEPVYKQKCKGAPLWIPHPFETSASTLAAKQPLDIALSLDTTTQTISQESPRPTTAAHHFGTQDRTSRADTWITIDSIFSANDSTDFRPDLQIPVRASDLTKSTDWPGHAFLLCNSAFLTRLTDLLKARKSYEKAKCDTSRIESATETFGLKLKMEIARSEIRLQRYSPEVRLAQQYNVFDNATSGPSATALKLQRRLDMLKSFLERTGERYADTFAALEEQEENLRAAQEAVNADLEKALFDADMLGAEFDAPDGAQAADVIGEYSAFSRVNGIKWDGVEGEALPQSLRVGPAVEETG